jgi:thiamine-monophosphate kinase
MGESELTVAELGEIALVERILEAVGVAGAADAGATGREALVGPGDDAAVLPCHGNVVLTADSQHEGVHFRHEWISAEMLGRRAIAVNASDLAAMGATPIGFLVSLALPGDTPVDWVERLARSMGQAAVRIGATVAGGDVVRVGGKVAINVTAVGECDVDSMATRRSGAVAGDRILVTGRPGRAAAGRQLLQAGYRLASDGSVRFVTNGGTDGESVGAGGGGAASSEGGDELAVGGSDDAETAAAMQTSLRAFLDPAPPVSFGPRAAPHVKAMMDISDGVAIDLGRMCRASSVGAVLCAETLFDDPVLRLLRTAFDIDIGACVLNGGDDYELLCAVGEAGERGFHAAATAASVEVREVGRFVETDPSIRLEKDGRSEPLAEGGWDHFTRCP